MRIYEVRLHEKTYVYDPDTGGQVGDYIVKATTAEAACRAVLAYAKQQKFTPCRVTRVVERMYDNVIVTR